MEEEIDGSSEGDSDTEIEKEDELHDDFGECIEEEQAQDAKVMK